MTIGLIGIFSWKAFLLMVLSARRRHRSRLLNRK